jgi:hypothetical protein
LGARGREYGDVNTLVRQLRIATRGHDERTPLVVLLAVATVVFIAAGLVSLVALLVYLL